MRPGIAEAGRGARVRPAGGADLPAIVALEREAFSDPWSARSFADLLASPVVWFAVAERDDPADAAAGNAPRPIDGFVIALQAADEGEIANIAVHPERRGRGVGAVLLDAALAQLHAGGVRQVYLEVRASNDAARRLYESRGFTEVGRRPRYYRSPVEDALVLRRVATDAASPAPGERVSGGA